MQHLSTCRLTNTDDMSYSSPLSITTKDNGKFLFRSQEILNLYLSKQDLHDDFACLGLRFLDYRGFLCLACFHKCL